MTGNQALVMAIARLRKAGVPDPARDARVLLGHAMNVDRSRLSLFANEELTSTAGDVFEAAVAARTARQPVSQIVGKREFYGREFVVTPDVLDPRPETETLIEAALQSNFATVLDLGTGSGCILLTILAELPEATGVGVDVSPEALAVALGNARLLGVNERATFIRSNWFDDVVGTFDLIVSNPPYVSADEMVELSPELLQWEPRMALTPGGDGLGPYREISRCARRYLRDGGRLLFEIGHTQAPDIVKILKSAGFASVEVLQDLDGRDRVISARSIR